MYECMYIYLCMNIYNVCVFMCICFHMKLYKTVSDNIWIHRDILPSYLCLYTLVHI